MHEEIDAYLSNNLEEINFLDDKNNERVNIMKKCFTHIAIYFMFTYSATIAVDKIYTFYGAGKTEKFIYKWMMQIIDIGSCTETPIKNFRK